MSARTADVQIYNINYLLNISVVVAVSYPPVQKRVPASKCSRAPKVQFSFIAERWIGCVENNPSRRTEVLGFDGPIPFGCITRYRTRERHWHIVCGRKKPDWPTPK